MPRSHVSARSGASRHHRRRNEQFFEPLIPIFFIFGILAAAIIGQTFDRRRAQRQREERWDERMNGRRGRARARRDWYDDFAFANDGLGRAAGYNDDVWDEDRTVVGSIRGGFDEGYGRDRRAGRGNELVRVPEVEDTDWDSDDETMVGR